MVSIRMTHGNLLLWRQHCTSFASFTCFPKTSDGHIFCVRTPFDNLFASLEISHPSLQIGVVFVEFWEIWFLSYFGAPWLLQTSHFLFVWINRLSLLCILCLDVLVNFFNLFDVFPILSSTPTIHVNPTLIPLDLKSGWHWYQIWFGSRPLNKGQIYKFGSIELDCIKGEKMWLWRLESKMNINLVNMLVVSYILNALIIIIVEIKHA